MPDHKQVWSFQGRLGESWTETWYRQGSSIDTASVVPTILGNLRLSFLHPSAFWNEIVTTDVSQPRLSRVEPVRLPGKNPQGGGPASRGDSIVWLLRAANNARRYWWMRGNDDADLERHPVTGLWVIKPGLSQNFNAFITAAAASGYGIRRLVALKARSPAGYVGVKSVKRTDDGVCELTLNTTVDIFLNKTRVILSKMPPKQLPGLKGHFDILNTGIGKITVAYAMPQAGPILTPGGRVAVEEYNDVSPFAPALCRFDHEGSHDTRDPFTRSRGASRADRLRLQL